MIIKILGSLFIIFVVSRIILRYRERKLTPGEFIGWTLFWVIVEATLILPQTTDYLARFLGVGRGVDAIIYLALIVLFYLIFRIYVRLEFIDHEITAIVRKVALKDDEKKQ
jgi:hypothetical protein